MSHRLPPHSTEAEQSVLGALLTDADSLFAITPPLTPDDFFEPVHRDIYRAVLQLSKAGTAIDLLTVDNQLKHNERLQIIGGSAFLAELTTVVGTTAMVADHANIVREKSRRRQLAALGHKLTALAGEDKKSADELSEMAEQEFLALSYQAAAHASRLGDMRSARFDRYVELYEADDPVSQYAVRTGFADLDEKLCGLSPGELVILAGRPGMGKTALALDIAHHVAFEQKKIAYFVSLEMSQDELFDRVFSKKVNVPAWKLRAGRLTEDEFQRIGPAMDTIQDQPLFIDEDPNSDLINIRSKARHHQMQHGLDLLIIDYLQLIEVTDRSAAENQTQRITHISKSLKRLARELRCPVLALSQLSRECERRPDGQKQPQLSDLRDSGSLEQDADRVLMLYREGVYVPDCDDPNLTDVFIRKNRNGPQGNTQLHFHADTMSFRDALQRDVGTVAASLQ